MKNFNSSFNADFCDHLEWALCASLEISNDPKLKCFWCDGVSHAPFHNDAVNREYLDYENIKKTNSLKTTLWMGEDGQDSFEATIIFGEKALEKYSKGEDLTDTIDEEKLIDWHSFDLENKKIKIILT